MSRATRYSLLTGPEPPAAGAPAAQNWTTAIPDRLGQLNE
jgi:hypothetical protein